MRFLELEKKSLLAVESNHDKVQISWEGINRKEMIFQVPKAIPSLN